MDFKAVPSQSSQPTPKAKPKTAEPVQPKTTGQSQLPSDFMQISDLIQKRKDEAIANTNKSEANIEMLNQAMSSSAAVTPLLSPASSANPDLHLLIYIFTL